MKPEFTPAWMNSEGAELELVGEGGMRFLRSHAPVQTSSSGSDGATGPSTGARVPGR